MIKPTEIRYIKKTNTLSLTFEDGLNADLTSEYLRCFSPSAEVKGHGPGQEVLQKGKENVGIDKIEPVGNYAVKLFLMMAITPGYIRGNTYMSSLRTIRNTGMTIWRNLITLDM